MPKDRIPTSRLARAAKVARLAADQGTRQLGTNVANLTRDEKGRQEALERRHLEAAEQIVTALGTMKGAAMKLGQVLSFLDVGLVPEEHREEFQRKLGKLRDAAPKVRFADMRKVIESELDEPLKETFAEFDQTPVAAASIGQVYKARLHDGREVAVKVQYPGVAQAVRADMQNLGMILRLMKQVAPGLDVKATAEEVRDADRRGARLRARGAEPALAGADLPRPPVHRRPRRRHRASSREKVIVTEFVHGAGFEEMKQLDQATRDRIGEIVFRFFFGCMYRHHQFSGDPHPGNFMLLGDGTRRVPRLRPLQGDAEGADRAGARLPARRPRGRRRAPARRSGRRPASSRTRIASGPTSCWPSSATRPGGTCSTRTSSSPRRSRPR